ncbi:MAG: UvrD-helicase domain-containing protein [Christensenellaceae bacterium]
MSEKYTPEQAAAIGARGRTIVSASAGSGKTFVMIRKLVSLILNEAETSEILAVTFTNKAASQMREKLKNALTEKINDEGLSEDERRTLKRKLELLPQADISTIHAFCQRLLKRYFYRLDLSADFSLLAEESEIELLQSTVLENLLEECYAAADESFLLLAGVYRYKRGDNRLKEIIRSFYDKIRSTVGYRENLSQVRYDEETFRAVLDELAQGYQEQFLRRRQRVEEIAFLPEMDRANEFASVLLERLSALVHAGGYYEMLSLVQTALPAKPRKTKKTSEAEAEVLEILGEIKSDVTKIGKKMEVAPYEEELEYYLSAGKIARALIDIVLRFDEAYSAAKREKGKLDYNDLEQFTLELLKEEDVVRELQARYRFVFIDEYQDVNPVQESILSAISGREVFLVGDRKQSIYAFRGSKSIYFADKIRQFSDGGNALYLKKNFRSADRILSFVNAIFSVAMEEDIHYGATSLMEGGGLYPQAGEGRVRLHVVPSAKPEKIHPVGVYSVMEHAKQTVKEPSPFSVALEKIIEGEMRSRIYDLDEKEYRPVRYGDIAILMRKQSSALREAVRYLTDRGIPVAATEKVNVCEYTEVAQLIDWLSFLDNGEQDGPLVSALLSAVGGFDEDDLATIRIRFPAEKRVKKLVQGKVTPVKIAVPFYEACREYAERAHNLLASRLQRFYAYAEELRSYAQVATAGEVLTRLIYENHLETEYLSYPNGRLKRRHVDCLIENAKESLADFLVRLEGSGRYIPYKETAGDDAVQVMTVHASKGLEYPVVIVTDVTTSFHEPDSDEVLFDGIPATKAYDEETMTKRDTLLRTLFRRRAKTEIVKDELNLFYVALTRAKYSLHLMLDRLGSFERTAIPEARSWADFFDATRFDPDETIPEALPFEERRAVDRGDGEETDAILESLRREYPYADAVELPVKSSASLLLTLDSGYCDRVPYFSKEAEERETEEIDALEKADPKSRERGLAYHKFLELVDFDRPAAEEYERLRPLFSEEEYALLSLAHLEKIFAMPVFSSLKGKRLLREQRFLCRIPANEVDGLNSSCSDEILFQGAMDLVVLGDEVHIVDYKFVRTFDEETIAHYRKQLLLYRKVYARITGTPIERIRMTLVNIRSCSEVPVFDESH